MGVGFEDQGVVEVGGWGVAEEGALDLRGGVGWEDEGKMFEGTRDKRIRMNVTE